MEVLEETTNYRLEISEIEINKYLNKIWLIDNKNLIKFKLYNFIIYIMLFIIYIIISVIYLFLKNLIETLLFDFLYFFHKQYLNNNYKNLDIEIYYGRNIEKCLYLKKKHIKFNDLLLSFIYIKSINYIRILIILAIRLTKQKNIIFEKYKSKGNKTLPQNYRWLIDHNNLIKLIDHCWYIDITIFLKKIKYRNKIFICNIYKNYTKNTIEWANKHTLTKHKVILLDIKAAFDSIEFNILGEYLLANLIRKFGSKYAKNILDRYMILLKYRLLYIKNSNIKQKYLKGIPSGLPSSTLIFTLFIEEIIYRWLFKNNYQFLINIDFYIYIYVDDIYIKIKNRLKTNIIINSLIESLNDAKLFININKCKSNLPNNLHFPKLLTTDLYLGIPFTRNKLIYHHIILKNFNDKYNVQYNWITLHNILINNNTINKKKVCGFLLYKLAPIINYYYHINIKNIKLTHVIHYIFNNIINQNIINE